MKGYIIFENFNKLIECKEILDGNYTCMISDYPSGEFSGVINRVTGARCNKEDAYDFETGALISLMKLCGREKVTKACDELYRDDNYKNALQEMTENCEKLMEENKELKSDKDKSWKNYQRNIQKKQDRINELERAYKTSNDDKAKLVEYYQREIKKLESENEKLKLDCEKLQHGYNDNNILFCGGRQNGKQYKALVDLFKKLDQKKVDAAYKETYNTKLPLWQKEVLKQMYGVYKESKEKPELPRTLDINGTVYRKSIQIKDFSNDQLDSLIEGSRAFTRKFDNEWYYKPPTKREEMWENIINVSQDPPVDIKVAKQDITSFLRELQDKMPEARWNGSDCSPLEYTNPYWFKHDYIYFALFRYVGKGKLKICYAEEPHSWINKPVIEYIAPMRWDLFKKGRLAVKVTYKNYKEFYDACERELGKKPSIYSMLWDDVTISICKKDGNFEMFNMEHQKKIGRKIVNWEDVR